MSLILATRLILTHIVCMFSTRPLCRLTDRMVTGDRPMIEPSTCKDFVHVSYIKLEHLCIVFTSCLIYELEYTCQYNPNPRVQNTLEIKERFLIRRNMTKRANFRGSPLFQATYNNNNNNNNNIENQTTNSTFLFFSFSSFLFF